MATNYYNVEMGVVDASGNLNVIYPVTTANNVAVGTNETLASRLNTINSNINSITNLMKKGPQEITNTVTSFRCTTLVEGNIYALDITWSTSTAVASALKSTGILAIHHASSPDFWVSAVYSYGNGNGSFYPFGFYTNMRTDTNIIGGADAFAWLDATKTILRIKLNYNKTFTPQTAYLYTWLAS